MQHLCPTRTPRVRFRILPPECTQVAWAWEQGWGKRVGYIDLPPPIHQHQDGLAKSNHESADSLQYITQADSTCCITIAQPQLVMSGAGLNTYINPS